MANKLVQALMAFRETIFAGDGVDPFNDFSKWEARKLRYKILWDFYQNNAYRNVNSYASFYRTQYGLYKFVRGIYNPAGRIGDFWATHLLGGRLEMTSEDASSFRSLPIDFAEGVDSKKLLAAIRQLWTQSNWVINKAPYTLYGPVMGDVGLRIVDDVEKERVYMEVIHPASVSDVTLDAFGNVKAYELVETRQDPRPRAKKGDTVVYKEVVTRDDGGGVLYQTFLGESPYAWNEKESEWSEDYGFIPFVWVRNRHVGLDYGWSEFHKSRTKFHEVDDVASLLSDHIRRSVRSPKLFAGIKKKDDIQIAYSEAEAEKPEKAREEIAALYTTNPDAKAHSLLEQLQYEGVLGHIRDMLSELERDFPELQVDVWNRGKGGSDPSGKALRIARQRTTAKAQDLRVIYDTGMVKAHQMAIAIAGERGYDGYKGFNLDSYAKGKLDHEIGERPVFDPDPMDDLEYEQMFYTVANQAKLAGVELPIFLKRSGWTDEEIKEVTESESYKAQSEMRRLTLEETARMAGGDGKPTDKTKPG